MGGPPLRHRRAFLSELMLFAVCLVVVAAGAYGAATVVARAVSMMVSLADVDR